MATMEYGLQKDGVGIEPALNNARLRKEKCDGKAEGKTEGKSTQRPHCSE